MQFARLCTLAVISFTCCDDDRSLVIVTPRSRHCEPRGNERSLIEYDASIELRPTVSTLHLLMQVVVLHANDIAAETFQWSSCTSYKCRIIARNFYFGPSVMWCLLTFLCIFLSILWLGRHMMAELKRLFDIDIDTNANNTITVAYLKCDDSRSNVFLSDRTTQPTVSGADTGRGMRECILIRASLSVAGRNCRRNWLSVAKLCSFRGGRVTESLARGCPRTRP